MKIQNVQYIIPSLFMFGAIFLNIAYANPDFGDDIAIKFISLIKQESYAQAYDLLSGKFKENFSRESFIDRQRQVKLNFKQEFGSDKIVKVEEIFIKDRTNPVLNENSIKKIFTFWKRNNNNKKERLFQLRFENDKAVLVGVNTIISGGSYEIDNYEFLPELQATLAGPTHLQVTKKSITD